MNRNLSKASIRLRFTLSALVLSAAAIVHAAMAGGCGTGDAIIHDECRDAGAADAADGGTGGVDTTLPLCN